MVGAISVPVRGDCLVGGAGEVRFLPFGAALEFAALAAVEGRFWVLGARFWALTPAPILSTGQALSQGGRGGRRTRRGVCRRVMGRFGVCTCGWPFFGSGIGAYVFTLTLTLSLGERVRDWRLGESGELFQVLEVLEDRFQEFSVVLGSGVGLWVVVTMMIGWVVVPWGAAATGGSVLFGHVGSEEHHQEGWRGAGLLSASERA